MGRLYCIHDNNKWLPLRIFNSLAYKCESFHKYRYIDYIEINTKQPHNKTINNRLLVTKKKNKKHT